MKTCLAAIVALCLAAPATVSAVDLKNFNFNLQVDAGFKSPQQLGTSCLLIVAPTALASGKSPGQTAVWCANASEHLFKIFKMKEETKEGN